VEALLEDTIKLYRGGGGPGIAVSFFDPVEEPWRSAAGKRENPSKRLHEEDPDGKDIAALIRRFTSELLWRHIAKGADESTGSAILVGEGFIERPCDAEVQNLHRDAAPCVAGKKDVVGFEIPVHYLVKVSGGYA
jgi:hypothetical protein